MPPEGRNPADPAEWLRRARSNLTRARDTSGVPDVLYEDLCFDAQQAAEKAIKAVLVSRQIDFPKTHALADLLTLVQRAGIDVPQRVRDAIRLTRYAVETRYPGLAEDVTGAEHDRAVKLSETVLRWAEDLLDVSGK